MIYHSLMLEIYVWHLCWCLLGKVKRSPPTLDCLVNQLSQQI